MSNGLRQDQAQLAEATEVVKHDGSLMFCERCGGTGNELFSMYRQCSNCEGFGVADRNSK